VACDRSSRGVRYDASYHSCGNTCCVEEVEDMVCRYRCRYPLVAR
jgi:hypothetical protein